MKKLLLLQQGWENLKTLDDFIIQKLTSGLCWVNKQPWYLQLFYIILYVIGLTAFIMLVCVVLTAVLDWSFTMFLNFLQLLGRL